VKKSALAPFLPRISACRSLAEVAGVAAEIMTAEFGAIGAAVFDSAGPVAARPVKIPARLIVELGATPSGLTTGAAGTPAEGVLLLSQPIHESDGTRIAAAWGSTTVPWDELRTMASVLAGWLEEAGERGTRAAVRRRSSTHLPEREDFTSLIDTIPAVVYIAGMGAEGRWTYVSPQIETVLGYTPEEWLEGRSMWVDSIYPDDLEHALSFEDERLIGLDMHPPAEYRIRARDGRYVWVYERARLITRKEGAPVWYGVMQDMTPLKTAEAELERNAKQQAVVAELARMAVRGVEPEVLLESATARIAELDRVVEASVWELDNDRSLRLVHRSGTMGRMSSLPFEPTRFPGENLLRGEPVFIPSWTSNDPRLAVYRDFVPEGVASSFAAPILGTDQHFGLILVHSGEPAAFSEEDGNFLVGTASVLGNAIERSRSDRSLHHRLNHDVLTDLPNRRFFSTRLGEALLEAESTRSMVALLFLDIDHFKLINDGIGHKAGDQVLRSIGPRLIRSVRHGDTVSRFGGDEFGIVLRSVTDPDEACAVAERILAAVSRPLRVEGTKRRITASIGISTWRPGDGQRAAEDLIQEADAAMYDAKDSGRSRYRLFDGIIRDRMVHRLEVERELHTAIRRSELTVLYQPIIELKQGRLTGFEALVRWQHPTRGLLCPGEFVPVAEESELIREIDTWVLKQAVTEAGRWNSGLAPGRRVGVSVNCSARQIGRRDLPGLVSRLLGQHSLAPELLTVELTETALLSGSGRVDAVIEGLDRLGVRISLDDFGTGFSSLGYLAEFPLDEIKIDRRFVDLLARGDPRGAAIADAIVQIGRALSMNVVAEAVATDTTLEMIRDLGCHHAQGYLFARPLDAGAARELITGPDPAYPAGAGSRSAAG